MKPKRAAVTLALFAALIAAFALVPLPISRVREVSLVAVHPDYVAPVGLEVPGQLMTLHVKDGQPVVAGQVLATFRCIELQDQLAKYQAEWTSNRDAADELSKSFAALSNLPPESQGQYRQRIEQYRNKANTAEGLVKFLKEKLADAESLKSPRDGIATGVPRQADIGRLYDRSGSESKPFCSVGDAKNLIVRMPVSPNDYRLLKENMAGGKPLEVGIYVSGRTDHTFRGRLSKLPDSDARQVPYGLTQRGGGPLAVKQSGEGGQEVQPLAQTYLIEIELLDADATIRPGTLVNATVYCQWRSTAWWVGRALATAMDIGLY